MYKTIFLLICASFVKIFILDASSLSQYTCAIHLHLLDFVKHANVVAFFVFHELQLCLSKICLSRNKMRRLVVKNRPRGLSLLPNIIWNDLCYFVNKLYELWVCLFFSFKQSFVIRAFLNRVKFFC